MHSKYHLITADFKKYDFHQLFDEEGNNDKRVLWKIGGKYGKNAQRYNVGDIVYLYYTNLPDESKRILLRAEVMESDTDENVLKSGIDRYSYDSKKENQIKGIWLGKIGAISLKDRFRFSLNQLKEYGINNPQGQRYLCFYKDDVLKHTALISEIENLPRVNLKKTKEYFDDFTKCFFTENRNRNHNTFISGRGVNFSEKHHFVLQSYMKTNKNLENVLNKDEHNLIYLCPNCHRQLHHGLAKDVKDMLQKIYEKNEEWCENVLLPLAKEEGYSEVLPWIYQIYDRERAKNNYELLGKH